MKNTKTLSKIDWNFITREAGGDIHALHPYPAKFIPEIPRTLLQFFAPPEGTAVFDPFCGSGTSLLEAHFEDIPAMGVDLNPIACLISQVKLTPLSSDFMDSAKNCVESARKKSEKIPEIPNLDHWFVFSVQQELANLIATINEVEDENIKNALKLSFSAIIVKVSNQESDTRYAAIKKSVDGDIVYNQFISACKKISDLKSLYHHTSADFQILNKNLFDVKRTDLIAPVGLVVTSPPYPNAYEYWLYHKYRMWWLGYDPISVKDEEIGARAHFFKKNPHDESTFQEQMNKTFKLIDDVLIGGGHICFVVGRSIIHGKKIDNSKIVENSATKFNFKLIKKIQRNIALNRKSFNLSHAKINKEHIIIFQKGQN